MNSIPGIFMGVIGGAVGGLVGAIIAEATSKKDTLDIYIDLMTGNFLFEKSIETKDSIELTIFRNTRNSKHDKINLFINDLEMGEMQPRSFIQNKQPVQDKGIVISIEAKNLKIEYPLQERNHDEIFLIIDENRKGLQIRELQKQQAEYHRGIILKHQKKSYQLKLSSNFTSNTLFNFEKVAIR